MLGVVVGNHEYFQGTPEYDKGSKQENVIWLRHYVLCLSLAKTCG